MKDYDPEVTIHPFLVAFAVERESTGDDLPGRYCPHKDVWVVDGPNGPTPIIENSEGDAAAPLTKIKGERDEPGLPGHLELTTKTHMQLERDDQSPRRGDLSPELVTKTAVVRERDDSSGTVLLELATKTETRRERDDR